MNFVNPDLSIAVAGQRRQHLTRLAEQHRLARLAPAVVRGRRWRRPPGPEAGRPSE